MKFKQLTGLLLIFLLALCPVLAWTDYPAASCLLTLNTAPSETEAGKWPTLDEIEGKAWLVLDCQTNEVLIENNADLVVYPASTTKIMTAILALETGGLDRTVTVSETAVDLEAGSSKVGFLAGEQVNLNDVLYGLMIPSGNDAANILAEALAGSREKFVAKMNEKAKALGMSNSNFRNPSGLHDDAHVVTARDMAVLAAYAMKNQSFREIVSTSSYSMAATNKHPYRGWALFNNTNRFLQFGDTALKSDLIASFSGIKTGSTSKAGNNLVSAAMTKSGHELICVLLGVSPSNRSGNVFNYSRTLLESAAAKIEPAATTSASTQESSLPTESETTAATSAPSSEPSTTTEITPTTTQPEGNAETGTFLGFLAENPWRTASLILILVMLILVILFWQYLHYLKQRRKRQKPRRIGPR